MKRLFCLLLAFLFFWVAPTTVNAAGSDFTVTPATPSAESQSYFQFQLKANATQTLAITITNKADHARDFELEFLSAGVSSNGQLLYTPGAKLVKDAGPSLLSMIETPKQTINVPANSKTTVETHIKVPNTKWSGERLGSWYVRAAKEKSSSGIQNRFAMAIPIHVTIDHALTVNPHLTLSQPKLQQNNQTPTITADLSNHTPRLFGHITQTLNLYDADHKSLGKQVLNNAQMAPNAIMPLQLPLKKALTPGTYTLDLRLTSGKQSYHLTKTLIITGDQIAKVTPKAATTLLPWWVYALIGLVVVMIAVIIWLLTTRRKS
ncbi:WxL protein host-binding domain-containing protein [Lacticaseibacillus porcinae]|uniref:WxL protein host-binding domain-containing protein n=1 Tax=Lacticaseibacillus porcinae TaxID=1123687 RepID=UPI000F775DAA|nr:DUF3324 domain-containing protein [Lacticaseibacillus porcinae]